MFKKYRSTEFNCDPEIEIVIHKSDSLVYLEHGYPDKLVRWHHHEEFELHLIVASTGRMFVGDYIGSFAPGNLVLTGPHLPHNWITHKEERMPIAVRDRVIQFTWQMFKKAYDIFPETKAVEALLSKAQFGIEFFGVDLAAVEKRFLQIRNSEGLERLAHFFELMHVLVKWQNYRLLNTLRIESFADEDIMAKINRVVDYLNANYHENVPLSKVAGLLRMHPAYFSRFFHKSTGSRFSDFLNRLRISRACDLLSRTNRQIAEIGYEVGYNNLSNFNRRFLKYKSMSPSDYRIYVQNRLQKNALLPQSLTLNA